MLSDYKRKADKLSENLSETEAKYSEKWKSLSENNKELLSGNISSYRTYTDNDGVRRMEILNKVDAAKENTYPLGICWTLSRLPRPSAWAKTWMTTSNRAAIA